VLGGALQFNDSEWDEFIKEVDENNDGDINIQEFKQMIRNLLVKGNLKQ